MESVTQLSFFRALIVAALVLISFGPADAEIAPQQARLGKSLGDVYEYWRKAMVGLNYKAWYQVTATHRRMALQNRIMSEKGSWPADIFNLPVAPPELKGLRLLRARSRGMTAKSVYFGKVDFGAGAGPTDNLLVLSFVYEGRGWKYDTAEFINLDRLKDVRAQLNAGDLSYVDTEDFLPSGTKPSMPKTVPKAKYIAEVYTYCPGREVKVVINKISKHRFQDNQQAEVVIGGARDGANELVFEIRDLPGYEGEEPLTLRIYLMSQVPGVKPVKVFQYETKQGEKPKRTGSGVFSVGPATAAKILRQP